MIDLDKINNSPPFSPERFAMNVRVMRLSATTIVAARARAMGRAVTDSEGPRGAAQFIRQAVLTGKHRPPHWEPPESPEQIAWLKRADWYETMMNAANGAGIEIP